MKKYISIILLLTIVLSSCGGEIEEQIVETDAKFATSEILKEKTFNEEIKLIGKVSSSKEAIISSLTSGSVSAINYKVGDKVLSGDILAFLDTKANMTDINYDNARTSYDNTSSIYDLSLISTDKDLQVAKLNYENAIINRDNIYKTTEKQLELAQNSADLASSSNENTLDIVGSTLDLQAKSLENAKLNLSNFEKTSSETEANLETKRKYLSLNIDTSISSALSSVSSSIVFIDPILGMTENNKDKNDNYDYLLGASNSTVKSNAKTTFLEVYSTYNSLKSAFKEDMSLEEKLSYLQKTISLLNKTILLHDYMTVVFENSIISVTSLSETTLSGFKSSNNLNKSAIFSAKSGLLSLDSSYSDLDNTINSTKTNNINQISSLKQAILIAESNYNNTLNSTNQTGDSASFGDKNAKTSLESTMANIESQRSLADNNIEIAEKQLNSTRAKLESQLFGTKSQLDTISGQMRSANQSLENSFLRAPFTGVIMSKNIVEGSFISPGTQAFIVADLKSKIVKLDISAENAKYLNIGKEVVVEKNGRSFSGVISMLSSGIDSQTKMFKAEISFSKDLDLAELDYGDFLDVYIVKESSKEKYLIVPFSSLIVDRSNDNFIFVVGTGSLIEQRKVVIGESNNREVIIKSGLKLGEKIVVNGALGLSVGDKIME